MILVLGLLVGCEFDFDERAIALAVDPEVVIQITPDMYVRHIQYGAFVFTHHFPWEANSLAVVSEDHLVLVDSPYTPQVTQEILDWMATQVGAKQTQAINTHFHLDNLGGNQYLIEQDIPVYGSDMTVQLLEERGQASLDQTVDWLRDEADPRYAEAFADLILVPPSVVFNIHNGLKLEFGGETLQVVYPGPGHSPDNVVVYFPDRKLLFGGCLIIGWDGIGNTSDADLQAWSGSVRPLAQFELGIVVPGHGERLDPELLDHTLAILANR